MARAIIRCSLDGDAGSVVRNGLVAILEGAGFASIGTFSFEARDMDAHRALQALNEVMDRLAALSLPVTLDHLWIYVDEPPPQDAWLS